MFAPPFLRIPDFPGHRAGPLMVAEWSPAPDLGILAHTLRQEQVGGDFWRPAAALPPGRDLVLAPQSRAEVRALAVLAQTGGMAERAVMLGDPLWAEAAGMPCLPHGDPWAIAGAARGVWASGGDMALVAALLGRWAGGDGRALLAERVQGWTCRDPFTGATMDWIATVRLLGEWRRLIDGNRAVSAVYGVAGWKRTTMDALLWDGAGPVRHAGRSAMPPPGGRALAWVARSPAGLAAALAARGVMMSEIEDGWIRSSGLGADCVPPLSIIVDHSGSPVDPARPSDLERLLAQASFSPDMLVRAQRLRTALVAGGVGKYGAAGPVARHPGHGRRRVLVVGQVQDDRAMTLGGAGCSNLSLLLRARALEPEAELIWRPHPDVQAGHRRGAVPDATVLRHADRIERHAPMAVLLAQVDGVHVISSGAGFEALLRGCDVVTHGVPFYAGWGLTRDLGPVPARRLRRLTLDEMVAAVLILYPRYLDPVTRLPCPPEVLVRRLSRGQAVMRGPLVALRRAQGRARQWLRRVSAR